MVDLIERKSVLDKFYAICDLCGKAEKYDYVMCRACCLDDAIRIVEEEPELTATVIEHDVSITTVEGYKFKRTEYLCSECHKKVTGDEYYCSYCGAKIDWRNIENE